MRLTDQELAELQNLRGLRYGKFTLGRLLGTIDELRAENTRLRERAEKAEDCLAKILLDEKP